MAYSVLLVEDDEQIREVITDYFAAKDGVISVKTAEDGDKGMELVHSNEYDLILLDVMLPGTDGFSLCRYIRAESSVPNCFLQQGDVKKISSTDMTLAVMIIWSNHSL